MKQFINCQLDSHQHLTIESTTTLRILAEPPRDGALLFAPLRTNPWHCSRPLALPSFRYRSVDDGFKLDQSLTLTQTTTRQYLGTFHQPIRIS